MMRSFCIGLILLFALWQLMAFAAPGDVTTMSGGAFSIITTLAGKFRATEPKSKLTILGSGGITVTGNAVNKSVTIDGSSLVPDWGNITNKPTTFVPAAHDQAAATVTGLATVATSGSYSDLANKPVTPEACGTGDNAIFDGAPALSCAIDSGNLAFTFDASGANPLPAMLPYTATLYEVGLNNNEPITPDSITWTVPASNSLIFGNSTSASFTPSILGNYSANRTNWIKATLTKGLKTCIALIPVSVTKEGNAGVKGDPGDGASISVGTVTTLNPGSPATVTFTGPSTARIANFGIPKGDQGEAAGVTKGIVQAEFRMDNPGGTSFTVRPDSSAGQTNATELITAGDVDGNKRIIVTGDGTTINSVTGTAANALTVNTIFPGYGVPLVNAWSERFTAIRTNDTVSVTAGKTYTETLTVFADGTITAASINFNTPNGDHIVPAYITGSQAGGYTLTATYTTETGGTTIRMPDISYLAGTVTTITIVSASLVQQRTNLFPAANFANLSLNTSVASSAAADGSRYINKGSAFLATDVIEAVDINITNGNTYQYSITASASAASCSYYTASGNTIKTSTNNICQSYTTVAGNNYFRTPRFYGFPTSITDIYIYSVSLIDTAEAAPPTTNLYTGAFDDLYHYTAAHTTTATAQTGSVKKLTISSEGVLTLW